MTFEHSFITKGHPAASEQGSGDPHLPEPRGMSTIYKFQSAHIQSPKYRNKVTGLGIKKQSTTSSSAMSAGSSIRDTTIEHKSSPKATPPMKSARTIPRSRHFRSPSGDAGDAKDDDQYAPHTTTAQGFPVNNKVKKAKYATSIDDRGYLTVYEFQLNDQTIMWDYATGFVHLTGIWKALGNSKADIVRLVDNHPELEGVIRRIRGGFLKIQGTWVPYDLCRRLALRTCYTIRHALISVFGPNFPDECLKPGTKGYGTLTLDDSGIDKKRKKRKAASHDVEDNDVPRVGVRVSEREKKPRITDPVRPATASSDSPSSSADYDFSEEDESRSTLTQHSPNKTSPPRLPRIVDLDNNGYYPSKPDLLDLLRASRSLQKLSAGGAQDWCDEGGSFNIAGGSTTFIWDGSDALEVLEPEALTTMDSQTAASALPSAHSTRFHNDSMIKHMRNWDTPPRMTRKYSSATQESSLGGDDYPITPPQQHYATIEHHHHHTVATMTATTSKQQQHQQHLQEGNAQSVIASQRDLPSVHHKIQIPSESYDGHGTAQMIVPHDAPGAYFRTAGIHILRNDVW